MKRISGNTAWGRQGWNHFYSQKTKWRAKDYRYLDRVLDADVQLYGRVIDVGCGLGDGLGYLASRARRVTEWSGVDYSESAIARAAEHYPRFSFYRHDVSRPLEHSYDVVLCLQVLEHVEDPLRAWDNLASATRDVMIVSSPYRNLRPDDDHRWSFDESDFHGRYDVAYVSRLQGNIFWYSAKSGSDKRVFSRTRELRYTLWDLARIAASRAGLSQRPEELSQW